MSNLDWIRTLPAEELKDWFYHVWLYKMAKSVTHSENYLVAWLNSTREEAICSIENSLSVQPENEFLDFLWNVINPNDMEQYLSMYYSQNEKRGVGEQE